MLPGGELVSGSYDNKIKIWRNNSLIDTLIGHSSFVNCLAVLPNDNLASGSDDFTIKIWRNNLLVNTLKRTYTLCSKFNSIT